MLLGLKISEEKNIENNFTRRTIFSGFVHVMEK